MSRETSEKILDQAQKTGLRNFPLEDVLFTGIFREMANITQLIRLPYVCEHYRYFQVHFHGAYTYCFSTHIEAHLNSRLAKLTMKTIKPSA